MHIYLYSPIDWFEDWDWRNADGQGIGGSETAHIEMAWRLAQRGHTVISYAPVPADCPGEHQGVIWKHIKEADFTQPGLWIIYRSPKSVDHLTKDDQTVWVVHEDVDYPGEWNKERAARVDRVLALCTEHANYLLGAHPYLKNKVFISANGIRMDLIREVEIDPPERNPKRLMYASSPDRGLLELLAIFERAKERDSELELHIYYGTNKCSDELHTKHAKLLEDKLLKRIDKLDNICWHNRVSQPELYRAWLKSGIWCYPTTFSETSCITCMEAQALGVIPITNPYWALRDNVHYGVFIPGDPANDMMVKARYVDNIVALANIKEDQLKKLRINMIRDRQATFNWERVVDQWECWIMQSELKEELPDNYNLFGMAQFMFQHKHSRGLIANVGCNDDGYNFRGRGAVNIDVNTTDAVTGRTIPVDRLADARIPYAHNEFDTVILGDILEHMTDDDAVESLKSAKEALKVNGRIIITVPNDPRSIQDQNFANEPKDPELEYIDGISHYHTRRIPKELVRSWCKQADLKIEEFQVIDYTFCLGWGIVAR